MQILITAILLLLDFVSKSVVASRLELHQSIGVIPGIFHLTLVHNTGAAFGLFKNQVPLFILTSLAAVVLIVRDLRLHKPHPLYSAALYMVLAGALGNLIDRVRYGYVIDFLDLRVWPVFNVADSCITVGVCLLAYMILTGKDKQRRTRNQGP